MAYVKIDRTLRFDILTGAEKLFSNRLSKASKFPNGFAERCYQAWLDMGNREIIDAVMKLPEEAQSVWLATHTFFSVAYINGVFIGHTFYPSYPVILPPGRPDLVLKGDHCQSLLDDFFEYRDTYARIKEERDRFIDLLREFLDMMPTLNRALVVFPELRRFVPDYYLSQLHEPKRTLHPHPKVRKLVAEIETEIVKAMMLEG